MVAGRTCLLISWIALRTAIGEDGKAVEIDEAGRSAVGAIDGLDQGSLRILADDLQVGGNFRGTDLRAGAATLIKISGRQKYMLVARGDCQRDGGLAIDARRRSEEPQIGDAQNGGDAPDGAAKYERG